MKEAIPSAPTLIYVLTRDVANRQPAPVTRLRDAERQCRQCKPATSPSPGSRCDHVLVCSPVRLGFAHPGGCPTPVSVGENLTGGLHHPIGKGAWPHRSAQGMVGGAVFMCWDIGRFHWDICRGLFKLRTVWYSIRKIGSCQGIMRGF